MKSCTTYASSKGPRFIWLLLKKKQVTGEFICWQLIFHLKYVITFTSFWSWGPWLSQFVRVQIWFDFCPASLCVTTVMGQWWDLYLLLPLKSATLLILLMGLLRTEPIKSLISRNVTWMQDILIQYGQFTWTQVNLGIIGNLGEPYLALRSVNMVWRVKGKRKGEKRAKMMKRSRETGDRGGRERWWGKMRLWGQVGRERDFLGLYYWKDGGIHFQVRLDRVGHRYPQGPGFFHLSLWWGQNGCHSLQIYMLSFIWKERDPKFPLKFHESS